MKLTDIFFTLDRLIARERNTITESRTVKRAANHNADVLERVKEIIDYSATAEMMAPPPVQYRVEEELPERATAADLRDYLRRRGILDPERYIPNAEVASTPPVDTWEPDMGCGCFRCKEFALSKPCHRVDRRPPGRDAISQGSQLCPCAECASFRAPVAEPEAGIVLGPQPSFRHEIIRYEDTIPICSCGEVFNTPIEL